MGQFICALVLVHFAQMEEALPGNAMPAGVKESAFAHIAITPTENLRSSNPRGSFVSPYIKLKSGCLDSVYNDGQKVRKEARPIQKLDEYVHPLGTLGCFILISNFHGINVPELNYPVVLRFPRLAAFPSVSLAEFNFQHIWLPHHLYPENSSTGTGEIFRRYCKLSNFLASFWKKGMRRT